MSAPVNVKVIVGEHESIDAALKRFAKLSIKSGLLKEFKRKAFYRKPSEARTFKSHKARHKILKNLARQRAGNGDHKPAFATNGAHR
jgi:small subunit ribosomal protein S21